jgi:hypothetical protein
MQFYAVLTVATVVIGLLTFAIWKKTGSVAFPIGVALLYYWTLLGAWFIVSDLLGGNTGMRYQYYFYKLFPIRLDDDYLWTLVLYASFIVVIQIAVLHFVHTPNSKGPGIPPIQISHAKILFLTSIAGMVAYLLVRNSLASAEAGNRTGYAFVRYDPSVRFFTVHQLLNRVAILGLCVGATIFAAGKRAQYIIGESAQWTTLLCYIIVLGFLFHFNLLMGNRYEIANSVIAATLFYLANDRRPSTALLGAVCLVGMIAVGYVGFTRGYGGEDLLLKGDLGAVVSSSLNENLVSNEPFEAHLSLYGVIHKNVPVTYGTSFLSLAASVVPRIFWPTRPDSIYIYYIRSVGAPDTQGYNIHHATGWYLNFGALGVIAGALLFGWLWAHLFNKLHSDLRDASHLGRLFSVLAFCTFTSAIPALVRAGIEGYKTIALEALIFPTALFMAASLRIVLRRNKPALAIHEPANIQTARMLSSTFGS